VVRRQTLINIVIIIISVGFNFIIRMYLSHKLKNEVVKGSSIGIIGGADGPTSIYVTSQSFPYIPAVIFALLSIAGVLYLLFTRKTKK
jgi:Na+-transporting methylmalonyl-CoA/oxaloacetate decarboxylase beta subunit